MARSRNIKPALFKNEYLAQLPFEARLLFVGLWTLADRSGRLEDRPLKIKAELFPFESVDVDHFLTLLQDSLGRFVLRYQVKGERFIQVMNFQKHQNPHCKEPESVIPEPVIDMHCTSTMQAPVLHQSSTADSLNLIPDSLINGQMNLTDLPNIEKPKNTKSTSEHFEKFWSTYPRKIKRKDTLTFWKKYKLDTQAESIMNGLASHMTSEQWKCENGKFVPHPITFLRQERYKDVLETSNAPNGLLHSCEREALMAFPFIQIGEDVLPSADFTTEKTHPKHLFYKGSSFHISQLKGVDHA